MREEWQRAGLPGDISQQYLDEAGLETELGEASGLLGMVAHAEGRWRPLFRDLFTATLRETPELAGTVFDAESPYHARGCMAQAWSVAEVLRAWSKIAGSGLIVPTRCDTTTAHAIGGLPRKERREKAAIPMMLPRMSSR